MFVYCLLILPYYAHQFLHFDDRNNVHVPLSASLSCYQKFVMYHIHRHDDEHNLSYIFDTIMANNVCIVYFGLVCFTWHFHMNQKFLATH